MNCQEILSSQHYAAMTLEQRGAVLGAYLHNVASQGCAYFPDDKSESLILEKLAIPGDVVYGQLDCESFRVGYKVLWADRYLEACNNAGVVAGERGIKNTGLVERAKTISSEVGYRELEGAYSGALPTSRYSSIKQVFIVTNEFMVRLESLNGGIDIQPLLSEYYDTLILNPKLRPAARNMPLSIARFIKKQAGRSKGVDSAIMAALEMDYE